MEAVNRVEEAKTRLHGLLKLQRDIELQFGNDNYNVFVFGSYLTTQYVNDLLNCHETAMLSCQKSHVFTCA